MSAWTCECGHLHAADEDNEDAGCRTCECASWRPRKPKFHPHPPLLAVDGDGIVWRVFEEDDDEIYWSMCPVTDGSDPSPEPITYYAPIDDTINSLLAALASARGEQT